MVIVFFVVFVIGRVAYAGLRGVKVPNGFQIEVFQEGISDARSLSLSPSGIVFVGSRQNGMVRAVVKKGYYTGSLKPGIYEISKGLNMPNGVAYHKGDLFVAEVSRILLFSKIEDQLKAGKFAYKVIRNDYPTDTHHGWKFIAVGPDGWLYVPVGAPCNLCESKDEKYASLTRISLDGSKFEIYAKGIRNTVGFDWHPKTKALWFTENGRDYFGDEKPDDELNVASEAGLHFGYPYCHADDIKDPEFGDKRACSEFQKPFAKLGPHVAALGMRFYRGTQFPSEYQGKIFIAQHGSWNRSKKIGYRVGVVDPNIPNSFQVFAEGWLDKDGDVSGRPVDVQELKDGSLLVSDDLSGAIYRVYYELKRGH